LSGSDWGLGFGVCARGLEDHDDVRTDDLDGYLPDAAGALGMAADADLRLMIPGLRLTGRGLEPVHLASELGGLFFVRRHDVHKPLDPRVAEAVVAVDGEQSLVQPALNQVVIMLELLVDAVV